MATIMHDRVCGVCRKSYKGRSNSKYCSDSCYTTGIRQKARENNLKKYKVPDIERVCQTCRETFKTAHKQKKHCSTSCRHLGLALQTATPALLIKVLKKIK